MLNDLLPKSLAFYTKWTYTTHAHLYSDFSLISVDVDSLNFVHFLGGLSLHLNHLIASRAANYDWPFGTLPFGLSCSNLDTRDPETYPRTYSGHF